MAGLDKPQILDKLNNPNPLIEKAKEHHKKLLMHVHGYGLANYLDKIEGLENKEKFELRKRLARSNKDFFSKLLRRTDKIFSAKGGSTEYGLKDAGSKEKLQKLLYDIVDGVSLDKWLENIWLDKLHVDPNGLILIEHKDGIPYPTYKSILTIRDYQQNGQGIDYFISEPKKIGEDEYIRVYDESGDYTYRLLENDIELVTDETFANPWGYVPAILCSDLVDPVTEFKKSAIDEIIEIADEYLRDNTVHILTKYHHGFPMFWQYAPTCQNCGGTGFTKDGKVCPVCNGSKHAMKKDVSDVTYLKQPSKTDEPTIAPYIAGYVTPPIEVINMQVEQLQRLDESANFAQWGTVVKQEDVTRTATEVFINAQPVEDRLNKYSDSYEIITRYLIDMIGEYLFQDDYKKTIFNAGRNYIVKGVNQLTKEYTDLKNQKAGITLLDNKLQELIDAKYKNNAIQLVIEQKLSLVEPFVHNTIEEVKAMDLPEILYMRKVFYNDWLGEQKQDYLFSTQIEKLKESLTVYTTTKIKEYATLQNDSSTATGDNRGQSI